MQLIAVSMMCVLEIYAISNVECVDPQIPVNGMKTKFYYGETSTKIVMEQLNLSKIPKANMNQRTMCMIGTTVSTIGNRWKSVYLRSENYTSLVENL